MANLYKMKRTATSLNQLNDFLKHFDISLVGNMEREVDETMNIRFDHPFAQAISNSQPYIYSENWHQVLLKTLQLLPASFYQARTFSSLVLGGTWGYSTDYGYFEQNTKTVHITRTSKGGTLLGLVYTTLHELGHTLEGEFFEGISCFKNISETTRITLLQAYYQERNGCYTGNQLHNGLYNDVLMYLATATELDINKLREVQNKKEREITETFRQKVFGIKEGQNFSKLTSLLDTVIQIEEERGMRKYCNPPLEPYLTTLAHFERRIKAVVE